MILRRLPKHPGLGPPQPMGAAGRLAAACWGAGSRVRRRSAVGCGRRARREETLRPWGASLLPMADIPDPSCVARPAAATGPGGLSRAGRRPAPGLGGRARLSSGGPAARHLAGGRTGGMAWSCRGSPRLRPALKTFQPARPTAGAGTGLVGTAAAAICRTVPGAAHRPGA